MIGMVGEGDRGIRIGRERERVMMGGGGCDGGRAR